MSGDIRTLIGDSRKILPTLEKESVQCCVTSPPYWGLRDYNHADQIGQESTPDAFIQNLVGVFREVHRALKSDGTLWVNIGDSYAAQRGGTAMPAETLAGGIAGKGDDASHRGRSNSCNGGRQDMTSPAARTGPVAHRNASAFGLKHKDLVGIPWMLAFALRADGWYLRQDIIWHKPSTMPESVTDRCTKAHEYVFLLSKSANYFYDHEAIKEPSEYTDDDRKGRSYDHHKSAPSEERNGVRPGNYLDGGRGGYAMRNKRSVWSVTNCGYREAHFATFPPDLIKPMILAGSRVGDTVLDPFAGSGTTGMVCRELARNAVLIDLNPDYEKFIQQRTQNATPGLGI